MKLIDLNRDGGIGANALFIQLGELRILVDAGLHPKKVGRAATRAALTRFERLVPTSDRTVEYLRRHRARATAAQYARAYAGFKGLGDEYRGWPDEGTWPDEK